MRRVEEKDFPIHAFLSAARKVFRQNVDEKYISADSRITGVMFRKKFR